MQNMNKFFIIFLRSFKLFAIIVPCIVVFLYCAFVFYNDFLRANEHSIARKYTSLNISDKTNNYKVLILTLEVNSRKPASFSITMTKRLEKTNYNTNTNANISPMLIFASSPTMDRELPKLVCDKRSIWGDYRADYKMVFLPSGSVAILDKNITNKKNVTLEDILNNSRSTIIEHENNIKWGNFSYNSIVDCDDLEWIGKRSGLITLISGEVIIIQGFDELPITGQPLYGIIVRRYPPIVP